MSQPGPINGPMPGSTNQLRGDNINEGHAALGTPLTTPMSDEGKEWELAQMVRQLFYRARDARRPIVQQWRKNYKVLNNRSWTPRSESWMPSPEVAEMWPLVAAMVSWMTDQRPGIETTPAAVPFSEFSDHYDRLAEQMNALLDSSFSVNQEDAEIEKLLWDVCTYSVGYLKTEWISTLADGKGDSKFRRVDPFTFYPDPYANNMNEASYFVEFKTMTMDDLDRAFPGSKDKVQAGITEEGDMQPTKLDSTTNQQQPRVNLAPINGAPFAPWGPSNRGGALSGLTREDPVTVVLEAWIRTYRVFTHKDDKSIPEGAARVIDRWKCIVVAGNTVILEKFADEIYGHPQHPYSKMNMFDTGEWYGPCLVEMLTSPQESINRILQQVEMNLMLIGNPILLNGNRTNVGGRQTISNRPGQVLNGNAQDMGWMDPPMIHPDMMRMVEFYETRMETISGLTAIMRGFSTTGRNSTDVISSLQDSAFVRVRATLRNLERCLRDACMKKCANIAEFYTEPRLVAVLGPDGTKTKMALRAGHFYSLPTDDGDEPTPMRFALLADAGSDHPTSRQARQAQAERLFAMGAIDVIEVLKANHWPNWPTVSKRVMDMQAVAGTLGTNGSQRSKARAQ